MSDYIIDDRYFKKNDNWFKNIEEYQKFKLNKILNEGRYYITEEIDFEQKEEWKQERLKKLKNNNK